MELAGLTIHALHDKLVSGEVSAMVLTEAVLTRLAAVEERIHAYITITPELARQQAAAASSVRQDSVRRRRLYRQRWFQALVSCRGFDEGVRREDNR